ncbi:MAG: hypothetical protein HYR73_03295, partial [Candidatus Eisenbacteria bacterium]|nr:hypothetical protein [Candidatus Eisenbacteria bacterium]
MRRARLATLLVLLLILMPASARASGGWKTFQRPYTFHDLLATSDTIWCATQEAGLLIYHRATGNFTPESREPGRLVSNNLTSLAMSRSGSLWIGTRDAGVGRLDRDGSWGVLNAFDGLPSLSVNVVRAEGDTLWIGTDAGIALYNGTEISGRLPDAGGPSPFLSNNVTAIAVRGDSLWVGTARGAYYSRVSTGLATWNSVSTGQAPDTVHALATDGRNVWGLIGKSVWHAQSGNTWGKDLVFHEVYRLSDDLGSVVASSDSGLYQWSGLAWTPLLPALVSAPQPDRSFATTTDTAGVVLAADRDGLFEQVIAPAAWTQHVPPAPPGNNCQNVVVDRGRAYVGTYDEGVGRFDGTAWTNWFPGACGGNCGSVPYNPTFAFSMLVDSQGYKWIGYWSVSVDILDDSGPGTLVQSQWVGGDDRHTNLWSAAADSDGGRWFGGDTPCLGCGQATDPVGIDYYSPSGIYRQNFHTGVPDTAYNMANNQVRSLAYDGSRRVMWVGLAGHGVQWFALPDTNGRPITIPPSYQPLSFNDLDDTSRLDVFAVAPHSDSVWVFSTDALRLFTAYGGPGVEAVLYSIPAAPAPRGAVHPMDVAADGTVWLGTANGVRVYHPGGATEDLTAANTPLANDEVRSVFIDRATGVVWIATASGLNRFDPGYVAPPPPPLPSLTVRLYPDPAL